MIPLNQGDFLPYTTFNAFVSSTNVRNFVRLDFISSFNLLSTLLHINYSIFLISVVANCITYSLQ